MRSRRYKEYRGLEGPNDTEIERIEGIHRVQRIQENTWVQKVQKVEGVERCKISFMFCILTGIQRASKCNSYTACILIVAFGQKIREYSILYRRVSVNNN